MSEVLYEQYKDALRRGHVAALRGRLDAAAAAYREAARIAPDRALPYVGLGGVLARLGRTDESLVAYAAALERAPSDEGAMQGRADVLAASDAGPRPPTCSTAWPPSSNATGAWPTPATSPVARSSWPSRAAAADRSRASSPGCAGDARRRGGLEALARALGVLDSGAGRRCASATVEPTRRERRRRPSRRRAPRPGRPGSGHADPRGRGGARGRRPRRGPSSRAHRGHGHRAVGQFHAAMDACYQALAIMPSDPDIHLLLAELYLDRGWRGPAADKLVLLGRLSQLTGDGATRAGCATSRPRDSPTIRGSPPSAPDRPGLPGRRRSRCYTRGRCPSSARSSSSSS